MLSNNDMNLKPEEQAAMDAMTSRNIKVPPSATVNGTYTRWNEIVVVESGVLEEKLSKNGAAHHIFALRTKVVPGGDDTNVGRTVTDYIRVNFAVIKGNQTAAGTNSVSSELTMSSMGLKKLKQLAVIAGFSLATGLNADILKAIFTSDGSASVLAGKKLAFIISENSAKLYNGEPTQNIDNFLKIGV